MYLSPEIAAWQASPQSWSDIDGWRRPYQIFDHAETLLAAATTEHHRSDAIINLKRAVDTRVRHLDDVYRFKRLPLDAKVQGVYDRMTLLGLIRPRMLTKLYEIRNAIEHRDERPPEVQRCHELLEFAWYFLKSTDHVAQAKVSDLMLFRTELHDDLDYWLEITLPEEPDGGLKFRGWIPYEIATEAAKARWYRVTVSSYEKKKDFSARVSVPPEHDHTVRFREDDAHVQGVFTDEEAARDLYRAYFRV